MSENIEVNCMQCPCLNNDADEGMSCNLGYKIKHSFFGASSENCKLVKIVYIENSKEKTFKPETE